MEENELTQEETPAKVEESEATTEETVEEVEAVEEETERKEDETLSEYQKRINTLTYKRREAERKAEAAELKVKELESKLQPKEATKKPDRYDFDDEDAYLDARFKYEAEQRRKQDRVETENKQRIEAQKKFQAAVQNVFDKGVAEFDDFDSVVIDNPDLMVSNEFVQAITDMGDNGHRVAYYFGKNPEKAVEIDSYSPYKKALALNEIERQLTTKDSKKTTNAPPPIKPVGGTTKVIDNNEPENIEEWAAWRRKQKYGS